MFGFSSKRTKMDKTILKPNPNKARNATSHIRGHFLSGAHTGACGVRFVPQKAQATKLMPQRSVNNR